jgi:DNA-binding transcriptional LysR family regulator
MENQNLKNIFFKFENSMKNLRIADLELFATAAHIKNLGKAASYHHLSQSAASAAIVRVESAFGLSLCTHEKRKFQLTREGEVLLLRIENWLQHLHNIMLSDEQIPIRLATTHAIAQIAIPSLLSMNNITFIHMRPDRAYSAIIQNKADIALVPDNSLWKKVKTEEISNGYFQIYAKDPQVPIQPIILPEDQTEVLTLMHSWKQTHGYSLPIKTRVPSWSLIANICANFPEVGFLPDFLAKKYPLYPVKWQPALSQYRILAIYKNSSTNTLQRFFSIISSLQKAFNN